MSKEAKTLIENMAPLKNETSNNLMIMMDRFFLSKVAKEISNFTASEVEIRKYMRVQKDLMNKRANDDSKAVVVIDDDFGALESVRSQKEYNPN